MTEQNRPTSPGVIDAAASGEDVHDRDTIPAPPPVPSDNAPTPAAPMRVASASADDDAAEIETLRDSEVDTWRPPPPLPVSGADAAAAAPITASPADAGSSIAPRELAQRPASTERSGRAGIALAVVAVLAGVGAIALNRSERASHDAGAGDRSRVAATSAPASPDRSKPLAAPSPVVAAAPPAPVAPIADSAPGQAEPIALAATADRAGTAARRTPRVRATRATPPGDLPEAPSREAIAAALNDLRGAIELCTDGRNGVAELDMTIQGSGAVGHVLVGGDFGGTPQGSCIARTLRSASFGPFQKPKFRVLYKLML